MHRGLSGAAGQVPTVGQGRRLSDGPSAGQVDDLRRLGSDEVVAVNQCSGNSRSLFGPRVPGAQWGERSPPDPGQERGAPGSRQEGTNSATRARTADWSRVPNERNAAKSWPLGSSMSPSGSRRSTLDAAAGNRFTRILR